MIQEIEFVCIAVDTLETTQRHERENENRFISFVVVGRYM